MKNEIGKRIRERRKELKITQKQVKEKTGISTGNLSEIENGNSLPSSKAIIGLSKLLECSTDYILLGISNIEENTLTETEKQIISLYRASDNRGKRRIFRTAKEEADESKLYNSHPEDNKNLG